MLAPFTAPVYIPRIFRDGFVGLLSGLRIISPRPVNEKRKAVSFLGLPLVRFNFPVNFVTAPVAANCFLLAILAIGREEVAAGTIGADDIVPIDIMAFFVTLAYMAISLDATGLIRWLAYKVLSWGGKTGRRLFFFLYMFWFALTGVVGNDPTILSGTPFLAYVTRVAKNIDSPRAWIFTQFAMANVASAILVSSNPTNLVLAGAFQIKFIEYTANIIVPVLFTVVFLFPFLLYVVFRDEALVPRTIDMHELPEEARNRAPVNPNIPRPGDGDEPSASAEDQEANKLLSLEEIMNPYLDKWSAAFIAGLLGLALIIVLVLNAVTAASGAHYPVYWVTLPAAALAFAFDMAAGWSRRHETREIAAQARRRASEGGASSLLTAVGGGTTTTSSGSESGSVLDLAGRRKESEVRTGSAPAPASEIQPVAAAHTSKADPEKEAAAAATASQSSRAAVPGEARTTLSSLARRFWLWMRETFPNASHTLGFLPWALVPFAFAMFVLVQALATKGWIPVFAYGWDHWVNKTGTVGAIGGSKFIYPRDVAFFSQPCRTAVTNTIFFSGLFICDTLQCKSTSDAFGEEEDVLII